MSLTPSQLHRVTLTLVNLAADAQEATQARLVAGRTRVSIVEVAARARYQGALDIVAADISTAGTDLHNIVTELGPRPVNGPLRRTWTAQAVTLLIERWSS